MISLLDIHASLDKRCDELRAERDLMRRYLLLRMKNDDMHGVMDASADIREIDARLAELALVRATIDSL